MRLQLKLKAHLQRKSKVQFADLKKIMQWLRAQLRGMAVPTTVLPLRLVLGIAFLVAGVDKWANPQFFDPPAPGYIGNQLAAFAHHSPLKDFLTAIAVPNADLFGMSVMFGELAIGLGTLVGFYSRAAAWFGLLLSLILWLSASWGVSPFYLVAEVPYSAGWLVLALAGPHPLLSLEGQLKLRRQRLAKRATQPPAFPVRAARMVMARRRFIVVGGAAFFGGLVTGIIATKFSNDQSDAYPTDTPAAAFDLNAIVQRLQAPAQQLAAASQSDSAAIATISMIKKGQTTKFTTPDTHEPAILIRQSDGSVKAFSRICTHNGCEVEFDATKTALVCPCHGSQFDLATGVPTVPPATVPLKSYNVTVDDLGGIIYNHQ